jgi:hypothetical protein
MLICTKIQTAFIGVQSALFCDVIHDNLANGGLIGKRNME